MTTPDQENPMTLTTDAPPAHIDVPGLGLIGEADLDARTADELRLILTALGLTAPKSTRKPDLLAWAVNGLRLKAMADGLAAPLALAIGPPPESEPEPVAVPVAPADTAALEPARPTSIIPEINKWEQLVAMAEFLCKADIIPVALRNKPADTAMVLLAATDLGITITQALAKVIVIDGKLSMMAELMVALVLRDGHSITPDPSNDATQATAHYYRRDNGSEGSITYTIDEAVTAGLCRFDEEGYVRARSERGKILPWEKHTPDMLWARCVSRTCRRVFPDSLAGVSYTPEELGYIEVEDDGQRASNGQPEATVTLREQQSEIARRIAELPDDLRTELAGEWRKRNLPRAVDLRPAAIRTANGLLEPFEARAAAAEAATTAGMDEAELVYEACPFEGCETLTTGGAYCEAHADQAPPSDAPGLPPTPECYLCGSTRTKRVMVDTERARCMNGNDCKRRAEARDAGEPEPDDEPSTEEAKAEAAPTEPELEAELGDQLVCTSCTKPIAEGDAIVWDDLERPYHSECGPF